LDNFVTRIQSAIRKPAKSDNPPEQFALEDPSADDPAWIEQRNSKTSLERAAYLFFAILIGCGGFLFLKESIESAENRLSAMCAGIAALSFSAYYVKKAWVRQRNPPSETE